MLIASELGTAMLGGWVRSRIERQEVSRQFEVLSGSGRQDALRYTHEMHALPFCQNPAGWGIPLIGPQSVTKLGISCLAALLDNDSDGARERFTLRFSHGQVTPLVLTTRQREEAVALINLVDEKSASSAEGNV